MVISEFVSAMFNYQLKISFFLKFKNYETK